MPIQKKWESIGFSRLLNSKHINTDKQMLNMCCQHHHLAEQTLTLTSTHFMINLCFNKYSKIAVIKSTQCCGSTGISMKRASNAFSIQWYSSSHLFAIVLLQRNKNRWKFTKELVENEADEEIKRKKLTFVFVSTAKSQR